MYSVVLSQQAYIHHHRIDPASIRFEEGSQSVSRSVCNSGNVATVVSWDCASELSLSLSYPSVQKLYS